MPSPVYPIAGIPCEGNIVKSTYAIAAVIAVVLISWLVSGQFVADEKMSVSVDEIETDQVIPRVRTQLSQAESFISRVVSGGKTQAKRIVQVKAEASGRVVALPVEKGAVVEEGDILCELSMEDRYVKFEKAKAALRHAKLEHEGALKLSKQGFQAEVNIASAEVDLISARANLTSRQLDLDYRFIRSPFRGIVQERPVDIGDVLQRGNICAEILDPDPLLVVSYLSEQNIDGLAIGDLAQAKLNSGETVEGIVSFISYSADAITRTYRIEIEIGNEEFILRDGLSADVHFPREGISAHRISPALLSLTDSGEIGIKIVDNDNQVRFIEVQIASDTVDGVWLTGPPRSIRLITLGQELVFEGQTVETVAVDAVAVEAVISDDVRRAD